MNVLILPLNEITEENVYFLDSKKNILMDGIFTKLIYTNEWFTMNGLYINLPMEVQCIETYQPRRYDFPQLGGVQQQNQYSGYKKTIYFSVSQYSTILHQLDLLEQHILSKYNPTDKSKHKSFLIMQSLKLGYFRIFHSKDKEEKTITELSSSSGFILKISGIWENPTEYGVSYKIMDASAI
jgi:hypothetical protein